jgi:hypothetical protein
MVAQAISVSGIGFMILNDVARAEIMKKIDGSSPSPSSAAVVTSTDADDSASARR